VLRIVTTCLLLIFSFSKRPKNKLEWHSPSAFVDIIFIQDIIHIQIDHFLTYQEAKRSESVIGGCKTSRKYGGRATSALFANFPFENGSATLPMAFKCLRLFPIEEN
jgi:hypothetical protein